MKYLKNPLVLFTIIGILVLSNIATLLYFNFYEIKEEIATCDCPDQENEFEKKNSIKVDIKGYVKKPGVYELEEGAIVNDLIKMAGGLKSGGTTDNLNLSKKLENEMVIIVLSKNELKKQQATKENNISSNITSNAQISKSDANISDTKKEEEQVHVNDNPSIESKPVKISLNNASKEELMNLQGIGESKALSIIEYRNINPFKTIEELINVKGIGESIYNKIKDNITI